MGFGREMKDFAEGFRGGYEIGAKAYERWEKTHKPSDKELKDMPGMGTGIGTVGTAEGGNQSTAIAPAEVAWNDADPTQKAFLNTLAGPESGGEYNIIYGGDHFEDYSKHPGKYVTIESGPNKGKKSSAAGKYQFLESTWNDIASRHGLKDFSPENQDKAAWYLASETYGRTQGRSLSTDLNSKDPKIIANVGKALAPIWTSLPSGIEQGTSEDKFVTTFNKYLQAAPSKVAEAVESGEGVLPEPGAQALAEPTSNKQAQAKTFIDAATAKQMDPDIVKVTERAARDNPGLFAFNPKTKTLRTEEEQRDMVKKGWSKTMKSKHREGKAVDLVPINPETGQADPDYQAGYGKISEAMRKAAEQEGIKDLKWGGDWKSFQDKPHWQVSMLEQQQQIEPGGFTTPEPEEEVRPTMFAQTGGVLPEPVQSFQAGGTPDPYNPGRAITQITPSSGTTASWMPQTAKSSFVPRRVGQPSPTAAAPKAAGPSYVERFRQVQADAAAARAAEVAAKNKAAADAAAAAAANKQGEYYKPTGAQWLAMSMGADPRRAGMTPEQIKSWQSTPLTIGNRSGGNPFAIFGSGMRAQSRGGAHYHGGMVGMQEGGVIPDENESGWAFARGGQVADRDEQFQRLLRQESRPGRSAQEARDTAAKRLSSMEGRPTSSAYRPSQDKKYFQPAKPRKGAAETPKTAPTPTARPDPTTTSSTEPTRVIHPPNPTVGKAVAATGMTYPEKMGTAAQDAIDAAGPPKTPPAKAAGTDVTGYEPEPVTPIPDIVTDPRSGYKFNPETGSIVGKPEYGSPGAEPPPKPVAIPEPVVPDNAFTQPLGAGGAAPAPEGFGVEAAPAAPAPQEPARPEHAQMIAEARQLIASGQISPREIGEKLRMLGLPETLWPIDIQKAVLGFQEGGVIPEPGQPGYNEAVAEGQTATRQAPPVQEDTPKAKVRATPELKSDVSKALDGGIRALTRIFGLKQDGAVPTPDGQAVADQGAQRFASGEGAATSEEINDIDDNVDPDRELDEGHRQMNRLAQTMQWYKSQGRDDEAEVAAASLMQYGAQRMQKLGSMAQAAYKQYQATGDQQHLDNTLRFMEKAYQMVPDGSDFDVNLDPATGQLMATKINSEGEEESYNISPNEIPKYLKMAQDGSGYWDSVFRIADPEGQQQKARKEELEGTREYQRGEKREERTYEEKQTQEERTYEEKKAAREAEAEAAKAEAKAKTDAAESDRRAKRDQEIRKQEKLEAAAIAESAPGKEPFDWEGKVAPLVADADAAVDALAANKGDPELTKARDEALSRLQDALGGDPEKMEKYGYDDFTYTRPAADPAKYPGAFKNKNGVLVYKGKDGKYRPVPTS